MKVLLVNPPWYRFFGCSYLTVPLGLAYIGGFLRAQGVRTRVYNADFQVGTNPVSAHRMTMQHPNYVKALNDAEHPVWGEVSQVISKYRPDVVGISAMSVTLPSAIVVARICKQLNKNIITVIGGPHATLDPHFLLTEEAVDVVTSNEGEHTFFELVSLIERNMPLGACTGIAYRRSNHLVTNPPRPFIPDLDSLPFPAKDLVLDRANYPPSAFGEILASRGCPFNCTYCAAPLIWGGIVRRRSVENVIAEMEWTHKRFKTEFFEFRDDIFTLDRSWTADFCDKLKALDKGFKWGCITRADFLDAALITELRSAGCKIISIALESSNSRTLSKLKKRMDPQTVRQAAALLNRSGMPFHLYVMVGFPWETKQDMWDTITTAKRMGPKSIIFSVATPYPKTELLKQMRHGKNKGCLADFFHQNPVLPPKGMDKREFVQVILELETEVEAYNHKMANAPLRTLKETVVSFIRKNVPFAFRKKAAPLFNSIRLVHPA